MLPRVKKGGQAHQRAVAACLCDEPALMPNFTQIAYNEATVSVTDYINAYC